MSKRLVAAGVAAVALFTAVAAAQPSLKTYTDSQNRFSFQYPASLPLDVVARPNQPVNLLVGAAAFECQMFLVERPEFVDKATGDIARAYTPALAADVWKRSADGFALYGRHGTVVSATVDTAKFWPVQRASMTTDEGRPVVAAMQVRPGVDVWQFCTGFDNSDHTAVFNQILSSFAGPNDAAQQAQAEAASAAAAAAEAAVAAAEQAAAVQKEKGGGRRH